MADTHQSSLLNGTPPQLVNTSFPPSSILSQPQQAIRNSPVLDHSQNELQKPQSSMVNGQVSPMNTRNASLQQHSGQLTNHLASNSDEHRTSQQSSTTHADLQPSPLGINKSNVPFVGMQSSKMMQNTHPPLHQQSPSSTGVQAQAHVSDNAPAHGRPQTHFNYQTNAQHTNYFQPSPLATSKPNSFPPPNSSQPPNMQQAAGKAQRPLYQQTNKNIVQPPVAQYPGVSFPGAPLGGQMTKPMGPPPVGPPAGPPRTQGNVPSSEHSPYARHPISNPPQSNTLPPPPPPSSGLQQEANLSPLHQGFQPSPLHMNKPPPNPQFPSGVPQSFPHSSVPPSVQSRPPGIPQGYQPPPLQANQQVNRGVPSYNQTNSDHGIPPGYQNQITPNRSHIGPPPKSVPPAQRLLAGNRMQPAMSGYGDVKYPGMNNLTQNMERMSVTHQGFNQLWGKETLDLLQCRNVLPQQQVTPPPIRLHQEFFDSVNCSPEILCCTLNKIPETNSLLQKSRLPLGILIHPFRDLSYLNVVQCLSIVRCRACRTYINPFVYFVDNKRWKCNLCFRVNELPDEFQYDPVSQMYGDPSRRPEIKSSTIEFIAPSEYMLRPPQPAIYLFLLDISRTGCDTGYLETLCSVLIEELDNLPGDGRTQVGFILFDSYIHFFSIAENYNQAHEMIVTDIDDVFLPTPDSLLVNLNENRQLIEDLLHELPNKYRESYDTDSAFGPALQAAFKLMTPTGGRITVFQSCIPNKGPGALSPREDPNQRSSKDVHHLGPQTDFYKRLSLDCATHQITVDLFLVSSQYSDLATLGGISQFSGGCIHHFPLFRKTNVESNERLVRTLRRYLTRKIGFEAVMRVRCSRGLSIHTFHGNFFVRSTDLLTLPTINPDAGFGMQVSIEDSLSELQFVCFQAALLYTSSKGERRIRVHTLCIPVASTLSDILSSADQQAIIGLLAKMAVDRSLKSNLSDAREAFINVAVDILSAYKLVETSGGQNTLLSPLNLSLIPLYILALLKSVAFRTGQSTRLDERVYVMYQMKTLPIRSLIQLIHPDLYCVTTLDDETGVEFEDRMVPQPPRLSLSSEHLDSRGAFLLDTPEVIYLLLGKYVGGEFLRSIFDVTDIKHVNEDLIDLPELENDDSEKLRLFIYYLQSEKPWPAVIKVLTEPKMWTHFLINDKAENALSYYELLHHIRAQIK